MEITSEVKKQLEEQKKQCVFCKIISKEMEGNVVFEDDKTIALLDIYPAVKGHTVFMLKEHYPMPAYISREEFKHKFSLIPGLSGAVKKAMVKTGMNVFVAIGGIAGQQSYHFLVHLLPREEGDGFFNFLFNKKGEKLSDEEEKMLKDNFSIMMDNHFKRNPADWHSGSGEEFSDNFGEVIYEDEKIACVIPENNISKGHLVIYSKTEEKYVENLSQEDSAHLWFSASLASTLVFEGLKAHASNIILKSGECDDNPNGRLCVHVLPRWQDDELDLMWKPKQPSYDLKSVASKIKDKTWNVKYYSKEVEVEKNGKVIDIESKVIKISEKKEASVEEEIRKAIEIIKK